MIPSFLLIRISFFIDKSNELRKWNKYDILIKKRGDNMAKILVSQCLLGCCCRYKGDHCQNDQIISLAKHHILIPVCPEQMGGLPTPRNPSEIVGNKVVSCQGKDVTSSYHLGAKMALYIAKLNHIDIAIMKIKSPSCGKGIIYDGTFTGHLKEGNGVTVDLLLENGIEVYHEEEMDKVLERLKNSYQ